MENDEFFEKVEKDSSDEKENNNQYLGQEDSPSSWFEAVFFPFFIGSFAVLDVAFLHSTSNGALTVIIGIFQIIFLIVYFRSVERIFRNLVIALGRKK